MKPAKSLRPWKVALCWRTMSSEFARYSMVGWSFRCRVLSTCIEVTADGSAR